MSVSPLETLDQVLNILTRVLIDVLNDVIDVNLAQVLVFVVHTLSK